MAFDLKPLLRGEVSRICIKHMFDAMPMGGTEFPEGIVAEGVITDNGGYMRLSLTLTVPYVAECARCLAPVSGVFEESFARTVVRPGALSDQQLEESFDEYAVLDSDGMLDIDCEVTDTVALTFPKKLLCREDCPGLCPVCGKSLSEGDCGCAKKEIDPRLAVLKKLLDNSEI